MTEREQTATRSSVDEAMNRILSAEREARAAVEGCRGEAAAIVAAAEERAKRIVQRADRRIQLAHRRADEAVERAVKELLGGHAEVPAATPAETGGDVLDAAVAALADEIIGARQ